jgi:hypothetical protein
MSTSMRHVQVYYLGWMFMSTLDVHVSVMRGHAACIRTHKLGHKKSEEMDTVMDMDMDVDMDMKMDTDMDKDTDMDMDMEMDIKF